MFTSCCREGSDNLGMQEGAPGSSELLLPPSAGVSRAPGSLLSQCISAQNINSIPFFGGKSVGHVHDPATPRQIWPTISKISFSTGLFASLARLPLELLVPITAQIILPVLLLLFPLML